MTVEVGRDDKKIDLFTDVGFLSLYPLTVLYFCYCGTAGACLPCLLQALNVL